MARSEIKLPSPAGGPVARGPIPSVVIVGRPNVGKSSLLNCLARQRIAIVDPTAGVTRDRIAALIEREGRLFELWDTGGIGTTDDLAADVQMQIETALARADLVLFVVDAQQGMLPLDAEIARRLRQIGREVVLVANKVDHPKHEDLAQEFTTLGFGRPMAICALQGFGRTGLMDAILCRLPERSVSVEAPSIKLAVVGRQNVGKSTLINTLVGEQRVIVSDLPGTTRDAVDVRFARNGRAYVAVDTAGVKRKSRLADSIEFYSLARAHRAIRRCDVAVFMLDISSDISHVDKQIASTIERECKPCVLAVNKWDLAEKRITTEQYVEYLNAHLSGLAFAPIVFICAKDDRNVDDLLKLAEALHAQARQEVPTARLNETLRAAVELNAPKARYGKKPKFFYVTQIGVSPPTLLVFASNPHVIDDQYTRFLGNFFRSHLPFPEVPVRFIYRSRHIGDEKGADERPRPVPRGVRRGGRSGP